MRETPPDLWVFVVILGRKRLRDFLKWVFQREARSKKTQNVHTRREVWPAVSKKWLGNLLDVTEEAKQTMEGALEGFPWDSSEDLCPL